MSDKSGKTRMGTSIYTIYIFARNGNANEPIKYIQLCNLLRSFPYFPINFLKPFQGFHGCFERVFWSFLLQGWLLSPSRPQRLSSPSLSNGAPLFRHLGGGSGTHRRLSCFHFWAPGYPKMMENYGKSSCVKIMFFTGPFKNA